MTHCTKKAVSFKVATLITVALLVENNLVAAAPSHRPKSEVLLLEELDAMIRTMDAVLNEYIVNSMECQSISACRGMMTGLKLTNLPDFYSQAEISGNWSGVMESNTNGLQDFNHILKTFFNLPEEVKEKDVELGSGEKSMPLSIESQLRDVAVLLYQFIPSIQAQLQQTFCLDISIRPLHDYPMCLVCQEPSLPSPSVEVARNFQFMLQFYDFLDDYSHLYRLLLLQYPRPEYC